MERGLIRDLGLKFLNGTKVHLVPIPESNFIILYQQVGSHVGVSLLVEICFLNLKDGTFWMSIAGHLTPLPIPCAIRDGLSPTSPLPLLEERAIEQW